MMKKQFTYIALILLTTVGNGFSQVASKSWKYDFGNKKGNLSPVQAKAILSSNDGTAGHVHDSLPAPGDQQSARIWTGNQNVGGYSTTRPDTAIGIGSASRLKFIAPPTSSTSKFSILNIEGTNLFSIGFKVRFEAGNDLTYRFALGNDSTSMNWSTGIGASPNTQFSNQSNFNDANAIAAILLMQWKVVDSRYTLSIREKRSRDNNVTFDGFKDNNDVVFENEKDYQIQIYANNSALPVNYSRLDDVFTVNAGSCHIWVNNIQLLYNTNDANFKDVGSSLKPTDALNAFMFLGYNNADKTAKAYLDDFSYANYLADLATLPINLTGFNATPQNNSIKLNWSTTSEKNNDYFDILRSENSENFVSIATVKGSGTTQTMQNYNFTDYSPLAGTNYYQLKQVDTDGQSSLSKIVAVRAIEETSSLEIIALAEEQAIQLTAFAEKNSTAQITINDLSGKRMITNRASLIKGYNTIRLPASLAKGIYVLTIEGSNLSQAAKFIF